jgi:hypothetical protein
MGGQRLDLHAFESVPDVAVVVVIASIEQATALAEANRGHTRAIAVKGEQIAWGSVEVEVGRLT